MYKEALDLALCVKELRHMGIDRKIEEFREKLDPNHPIYAGYLRPAASRMLIDICDVTMDVAVRAINIYLQEG